ncbi:cell division protein FtsL [Anaeroselena agilis]|uniref:Cell division protein FtsL n=1 Tax=Anaeroselena agilis TaxID=3063788 RepID=A0ABU3NY13_9FIRM|nr:cell division protein FtsL [Selenomonadales bacterium 4137-cl]
MLVNRKQEWVQPPEPERAPLAVAIAQPRPYPSLRKQFLQLVLLAAALAMLITMHSAVMVRTGYDLVEMKAQAATMERENELLRLEIAKLKSPQRIQQIATKQLGMVTPQNTYYATAAPSSAVKVAGEKSGKVVGMLGLNKAEASKRR